MLALHRRAPKRRPPTSRASRSFASSLRGTTSSTPRSRRPRKWFYRAANSLHIISKESFVRSRLLLKEGDPYSEALAEESARVLRELGFINPVLITARRVDGGVEVTVETHDQWTLELGGSAGLVGNRADWGIEFQEKNFLGRGKKFDLEYSSDVERSETVIGYFDPNILGSWWRAELWLRGCVYDNVEEGIRRDTCWLPRSPRCSNCWAAPANGGGAMLRMPANRMAGPSTTFSSSSTRKKGVIPFIRNGSRGSSWSPSIFLSRPKTRPPMPNCSRPGP